MKNITKRSKKNPWRNTRNDFKMPWQRIWGTVFMIFLPFGIFFLASNIIFRSSAFYSFYITRGGVASELPYDIESSDVSGAFHDFMMHRESEFALKENSDYKPQQVFSDKAAEVMGDIRFIADITLIVGVILLIACLVIGIWLCLKDNNKLLYDKFKMSWAGIAGILLVASVFILVSPLREAMMFGIYGRDFPPGDSLLKIFEMGFWTYYGIILILTTIGLMLILLYIMKKFVVAHKMFKL